MATIIMGREMLTFLVALYCVLGYSWGLFADQAGLFDWKQDYVGKVKDFYWEQSSTSASVTGKRILVASERNVIASLNAHDGSIGWRRIFEPDLRGRIDAFIHHDSALISIHAGGQFVRSWQVASGSLLWEKSVASENNGKANGMFVLKNSKADRIIIATSMSVTCLRVQDGGTEWTSDLSNLESVDHWYIQEHTDGFNLIGIFPGQRVTIIPVRNDGKLRHHQSAPAPWIQADTRCTMIDGKNFVCYASGSLHLLPLDSSNNVFIPTDLQTLGLTTSELSQIESVVPELGSTILFRSTSDQLALLSLTTQLSFSVTRKLEKTFTAHVLTHGDSLILLALQREDADSLRLKGFNLKDSTDMDDLDQVIPYAHYHGNPTKMYPVLFSKKKDSRPGCKLIFAGQDYSLHFSQKNKMSWRREEAMAYILAVQMADLPVSDNQAKFEDEFGTKNDDIVAMFIKRFKAQISQIKGLVLHIVHRLKGQHSHHAVSMDAIEEEEPEEEDLIRDDFNLHKIIVAATAAGKIYGIRSHTGKIAWQQFVPNLKPFSRSGKETLKVVIQRTSAHFPREPVCSIVGVNKETGNGLIVSLNPVTGEMSSTHQGHGHDLGYKVIQVDVLSEMNEEFLKGLLFMDDSIKPHVYPASCESVIRKSSQMQHFFYLTDQETSSMTGYRLVQKKKGGIDVEQVWNLALQKSQQSITAVYSKRPIEHVHSQGRVLGDRSVLYKYLNPNLVAVVTEGEEHASTSSTKGPTGFFSIYLVDGVTGHLVFHQTHKRCRGPIKVIHSENWVVYSYYNEKNRRNEVGVMEMFEGKEQSNSTAFSSFNPPLHPLVMRQSYIFPEPLYAMEATVTEKGIASKSIIVSLKMGGVLSMPKALLDPRRPAMPTQQTMEEGTIPYVPEIGLSTEALINYNQSMINVDGVFTFPAGLESTSLVFVYGVDVFYTRVTPSRMFDVLKEDFDYLFIGAVLGVMILASVITQKLAAKKALNRAWK